MQNLVVTDMIRIWWIPRQHTRDAIHTKNNLAIKRPGNGISPMKWDEVIGTLATRNYSEDDLI